MTTRHPPDQERKSGTKHPQWAQEDPEVRPGKRANETNKRGASRPTQKNEGRRTPESRSDRQSLAGSGNQTRSRKGQTGGR